MKPKPDFRCYTHEAFVAIIEKFKWPYETWMQDWPLEVSEKIDLVFCLQEYPKLADKDEKFLLMEGILYALDESEGDGFNLYSQQTAELLKADFEIHKYTIYYWTLYRYDGYELKDGFTITPLMRDVWNACIK